MAVENGPDRISRYEIQGLIARGGMARVYLARDPNTTRMVVVKLLDATLDSSDVRDRFDREARSLASLSHPFIVPIYDYGNFQDSPFIVMEYIRGETLEEKIKRRAPMAIADKLRLMADVCAGLAHAHGAGIIHRDVKPANLMVDEDERLKIIDFGIARVSDSNLTRAQTLAGFGQVQIGTTGYMSPEQTRGDEIDHRTDVFSIGVVCYELLSYHEAFPGGTPREVEAAVMRTPPPPLSPQMPELDPAIDPILARAMARHPGDRYQSVAALGEAFEQLRARMDPAAASPAGRVEVPRPALPPRPVRPAPSPRPTAAGRAPLPPPRAAGPQTISVDPTVLIDRASLSPRAPEPFEPTVVIERDDLMRRLSQQEPAAAPPPPPPPSRPVRSIPEPSGRQPRPVAADPTVMVTRAPQPPPRPAPSASASSSRQKPGFSLGGLFQPLLLLFKGGGARQAAPPSRRQPPGKPPVKGGTAGQGVWTRGTLIAVGMVVVAALFVVLAIQVGRWFFAPSGQVLTLVKPTGGTLTGPGLRCGTRGSECSTTRPTGDPIELQTEPDDKYVFSGFTGDCAPTGRAIMTEPKKCGATFTLVEATPAGVVTLTINKPIGGTIVGVDILCGTAGSTCTANLPAGALVTLHPQTDPGSQFLQFTGDCDANGETTMSVARTCGATFAVTAAPPLATALPGTGPSPSVRPPVRRDPGGSAPSGVQPPSGAPTGPPGAQGAAPGGGQTPAPPSPQPTPTPTPPSEQVPTDPGKPAEKPITPEEHARREIGALVKQYCQEYETLKPERVEKLFPQIRQTTLQEQFRQYKSLKCTVTSPPEYDRLDASPAGGAQIKFGMKQVIEMKSGGAPKVVETIATMVLSRVDLRSPWIIDRVQHEPKPK